ncbi:MAG: hypothetical protein AAF604_22325 [Acidobacteriota bacterium]
MADENWQRLRKRVGASRAATRLQNHFGRWSGSSRLVLLALAVLAMGRWVFPWRGRWVWQGEPLAELPDAKLPPYGPAEVVEVLGALARPGFYALSEISLDVLFPWLYATFLGALLVRLARRHADRGVRLSLALFLPVAAALSDLVENLAYAAVALGAGKPLAVVGVAASWGKWSLVFATLIALVLTGRFLWGRWLAHLTAVRVPLLALLLLVLLERLAGHPDWPTVTNMMVSDTRFGLATAAFAVLLTMAVVLSAGWLAWNLAPERLRLERLALPAFVRHHPVRAIACLLPLATLPLLIRLEQGSRMDSVPTLAALACGVLAAGLLLWLLEYARSLGTLQRFADRLLPFFRTLGPGYLSFDQGRVEVRRGHPLALGVGLLLAAVYVVGYFWLSPEHAPRRIPTIAYVLLLVALVTHLLSGIAFFLDRFRFPLVLGIALYAISGGFWPAGEHTYPVRREVVDQAPCPKDAVMSRLQVRGLEGDDPVLLTVVGASGGGIQAAGWTAQVLTGLQEALGPDFTRSIHLISSASGGSVGAFFLLETVGADGALAPHRLAAVREAAMASSLDATAWGLVFPDFRRAFLPLLASRQRDRAWALEQGWLQNLECLREELPQAGCRLRPPARSQQAWLSSWRVGAATGRLPGVIFNATFVQDGAPFLISNLDLSSFSELRALTQDSEEGELWSLGPRDFDHREHFGPDGRFDLPIVTAARLSASFPFVTPTARPLVPKGEAEMAPFRVIDGGLFDNFGTTAALRWILEAVELLQDQKRSVEVLYLQVNAFPEEAAEIPKTTGWAQAALDPLTAIVKVRTSTQRARSDLELELLARLMKELGVPFKAVSFRPSDSSAPPLSWELSEHDKHSICESWRDAENLHKVEYLRDRYFPARPEIESLPACADSSR